MQIESEKKIIRNEKDQEICIGRKTASYKWSKLYNIQTVYKQKQKKPEWK